MPTTINTRATKAVELRRAGYSFKDIGRIIGHADDVNVPVNQSRAQQLVERGLRLERRNDAQYVSSDISKQLTKELRESGKLKNSSGHSAK